MGLREPTKGIFGKKVGLLCQPVRSLELMDFFTKFWILGGWHSEIPPTHTFGGPITSLVDVVLVLSKGWLVIAKLYPFSFLYLNIVKCLGIDNREMKSESGFSFAIASQPL